MKFFCDGCNAKYSIADEKVRGKVVKVRCKRCDEIIEVSERRRGGEARRGSAESGRGRSSGSGQGTDQWYYSVDGETFGPLPESDLLTKYRDGELTAESFVWRDGFGDWKSAETVEPFQGVLRSGDRTSAPAPSNRKQTMGIGGDAIESVEQAEDSREGRESTGASSDESSRRSPLDRGRGGSGSGRNRGKAGAGSSSGRKERLNRLRNKLKSNFADGGSQESEQEDAGEEEASQASAEELLTGEGREREGPEDEAEDDEAHREEERAGGAEALEEDAERGESTEERGDGFELPPAGSTRLEDGGAEPTGTRPRPGEESHSDLFEGLGEESEESEEAGEEAALPTAPTLSGEAEDKTAGSFADGVTESLLIQLDKIQEEGRGKRWATGTALVVFVAAAAGVWYYVWSTSPKEEGLEVESEPDRPVTEQDDGPVQKTYSKDERQKILTVSPRRVEKGGEEGQGESESEADERQQAPGGSGTRVARKESKPAESGNEEESDLLQRGASASIGDDEESLEGAFEGATKRSADDDEGPRREMDDSKGVASSSESAESPSFGKSNEFAAMEALEGSSAKIEQAGESDGERSGESGGGLPNKLDEEKIKDGIDTVRKSVGVCRQRQARRGVPVEAGKVYLTLHVQPSGTVSGFEISPNELDGSVFERCLGSHKGRWRFGKFKGSMQKLKAPFILQ